jgi:hypothetical protein
MLKFDKIARDRQVSVILREKDPAFTRSFAIAIGLAAGLHLLFLVIFPISPFKILLNQTVFPPVQVLADAVPKDAALLAQMDSPKPIASGLPDPKPSLPAFPDFPTFLTGQHVEYIKETKDGVNPFIHIESEIYTPAFSSLEKQSLPPLSIVISGFLSELTMIDNGLNGRTICPPSSYERQRAIFNVLVEGRTGRIFWYEPVQLTENAATDRFVETLLREMQFSAASGIFVTAGEIEFHFNLSFNRP